MEQPGARPDLRLAHLLPARPGLVQRPRPGIRPAGTPARAGPPDLLLGGGERPAEREQRVLPRPARGPAGPPQAHHALSRPAPAAGGPVRARAPAPVAAHRRTPLPAAGRGRALQLGHGKGRRLRLPVGPPRPVGGATVRGVRLLGEYAAAAL